MKGKITLSVIVTVIAGIIWIFSKQMWLAVLMEVIFIPLIFLFPRIMKKITLEFLRPTPNSKEALALYRLLTFLYFGIIPFILFICMAGLITLNTWLNPFFPSTANAVIIFVFLLAGIITTYGNIKRSVVNIPTGKILVVYIAGKAFLSKKAGVFVRIKWFQQEFYTATKIFISFSAVPEERDGVYAKTVEMKSISTATPELCQWKGFTDDEKAKIEKDKDNRRQAVLKPFITFVFKLNEEKVMYFVANMPGNNPEEKMRNLEQQVYNYGIARLNTEFKKYYYGQLLFLMTGSKLDNALMEDMEILVDGKQKSGDTETSEKSLGLDCLEARLGSLGGPQDLHDAINSLIAQGFINTKNIGIAEAEELVKQHSGKAIANYLNEILKINVANFSPAEYIRLQQKVEAMEKSKSTYITDWENSKNWDIVKDALSILDEIKTTIKK